MSGSHDFEPKLVSAFSGIPVVEIACGEHHYCAIDSNGDLYTWGTPTAQYNRGQLGHGDLKSQEIPKRVESLEQYRVVKVSCGGYHTILLTSDGDLFGFGAGSYGEIGYGESKDSSTPKKIEVFT